MDITAGFQDPIPEPSVDDPLPQVEVVALHRRDGPTPPPFTAHDIDPVRRPWPNRQTDPPFTPGDWVAKGAPHWPRIGIAAEMGIYNVAGWPVWLYEAAEVEGVRWEQTAPTARPTLEWDRVRLGAPLPSHLLFGPHGQEVESLLEQILTLTPAKVMAIPLPADLHPETGKDRDHLIIPGEQVPARHPSHESDATLIATAWLEAVGWASGDDAGGHYYSGCYFDYHLSESHWLNALGILRRAVWATVRGEDLPPEKRAAWLAEWVSLANGGGRRERA